MTDPFNSPAAGGKFNFEDHLGKLLLVTPTKYETGIQTTFGEKDAVRANIVTIDEKNATDSEEFNDALIFGGVVIGQTKSFVGKGLVLGRLGQGNAKKGQKPPWVLDDPTEGDKVAARAYLATKAPQL